MSDTARQGYCPQCGGVGVQRERRIGGNDTCENGHVYPSHLSLTSNADFLDEDDEDAFTAESNDEVINIINKS